MHPTVGPAVRLIGLINNILRNITCKRARSEHSETSITPICCGLQSMNPGKDLALKLRERRLPEGEEKENVRKKV